MRLATPVAALRTVLRRLFGEFSFFPTDYYSLESLYILISKIDYMC
jgi:hypothetical protein